MRSIFRAASPGLLVTCLSTLGWAFSFGLGTQLLTLTQAQMGWSNSAIGWNTGIYYLGIALAALVVPRLMTAWGKYCPAAGMILSGLSLVLFLFTNAPAVWFALRFVNGMAGALSLVPLETYLCKEAPRGQRSRQFALYAVALTLGGAAGIGSGLPLFQTGPVFPFLLGGLISCVSGLAVWRWLPKQTDPVEENAASGHSLRGNFLAYGSGWVQGFMEGGLIAFLGLYLLGLGMSHDSAGMMMGVSLAGVILFQVPAGWLADRFGRLGVLLGCYAVVIVGLLLLPWYGPGLGLGFWLFLVGACSGALYPLGLALLGDRVPEAGLARAYALFMALECLGSVLGPIIMGKGRDWYGETAMFGVALLAVGVVLVPWSVGKILRLGKPIGGKEGEKPQPTAQSGQAA